VNTSLTYTTMSTSRITPTLKDYNVVACRNGYRFEKNAVSAYNKADALWLGKYILRENGNSLRGMRFQVVEL